MAHPNVLAQAYCYGTKPQRRIFEVLKSQGILRMPLRKLLTVDWVIPKCSANILWVGKPFLRRDDLTLRMQSSRTLSDLTIAHPATGTRIILNASFGKVDDKSIGTQISQC